mgnify:CR=1 FL=1
MIAATLVLVLGCCVIPRLRRRSAAERHVLWAATIAAAAAAPVLGLFLPSWQPDWVRHVVGTLPAAFQSPGTLDRERRTSRLSFARTRWTHPHG